MLRSALALSICTQQPFRMVNIRARRAKPGLMRQHLTAVQAAARICDAAVIGDEMGSPEVTFRPGSVKGGDYAFSIGTAGSCTLVLQTVLPPLLTAGAASRIRISGGTHNKGAPSLDFLQRAFLPLIERMGSRVNLELIRHGFYPRGGGEILVSVEPTARLTPLSLLVRGPQRRGYAEAYLTAIPRHVATRELEIVGSMLGWPAEQLHVRGLPAEIGPGNSLAITLEHEHVTEVFTGFGEKGVSAETVAKRAVAELRTYMGSQAAVGVHLADQLLLPMALTGGGEFTTLPVTPHFESHCAIIHRFLGRRPSAAPRDGHVSVRV